MLHTLTDMKEFTFSPINLWTMPRLYIVEVIETYKEGKRCTKTVIRRNPIYDMRRNG